MRGQDSCAIPLLHFTQPSWLGVPAHRSFTLLLTGNHTAMLPLHAGSGYGFGAGVRIDTPIGPLRLEYAMNDRRQTRFHLGIGNSG